MDIDSEGMENKVEPYKGKEENKQIVGEPVAGYSVARENVEYLPDKKEIYNL